MTRDVRAGNGQRPVLLDIKGLFAGYGESQVLQGIDLAIPDGQVTALLGRNGAGKSTTLKCITGLLRARSGKILLDGVDLSAYALHGIARLGIGYVPETRGIFSSLTVRENLMLPAGGAAPRLSLGEIFTLFPNLEMRLDNSGAELSGGEQQMLAIARVLRTSCRLLLLDEPTEGLAPVIVQYIRDIIRKLKSTGLAILLVEQNIKFAREVADRIVIIENGAVAYACDASELDGADNQALRLVSL